jgi:hypothetical protein
MTSRFSQRHELKVWPEFFEPLIEGRKTAEYRKDDRGFHLGDTLWLREWEPSTEAYTGREACAVVTHITGGAFLPNRYVMLSLGRVSMWHGAVEGA